MDPTSLLLLVALALSALGLLGRVAPRLVPVVQAVLCALGAGVVLMAGSGPAAGLLVAADAVSRVFLLALFLLGAVGWQPPLAVGLAALALLAAHAAALMGGIGLGAVAVVFGGGRTLPGRSTAVRLVVVAALCLAAALLLEGRLDLQFSAMRGQAAEGLRGVLLLVCVLAAAGLLAVVAGAWGGLLGVYLMARLLLDLPGAATPGWWGAAVLLAGAACAVVAAWQAAAAATCARAADAAGLGAMGLATAGLGAALLARGADLVPAECMGAGGALLAVLAWAAWGGALHLAVSAPVARGAGLALGAGLLCMAVAPVSVGFAVFWTVLQAMFMAARVGGAAGILVAAAAASGLGLATALGMAAALRQGRAALARAALPAPHPTGVAPWPVRGGLALYAGLALLAGILPGPVLLFVQPGVVLLAGARSDGVGVSMIPGAPDAPGYAAPVLLLLLAAGFVLAVSVRGAVTRGGPVWRGGAEVSPHASGPVPFLPRLDAWRPHAGAVLLGAMGCALALLVGWAAGR